MTDDDHTSSESRAGTAADSEASSLFQHASSSIDPDSSRTSPLASTTLSPSRSVATAGAAIRATSAAPAPKKLHPKRSSSATNSPLPSRETSPIRSIYKASGRVAGSRSRQNSIQEDGPLRPTPLANVSLPAHASNTSSAGASAAPTTTARRLSATPIPVLAHASSDSLLLNAPMPHKIATVGEDKSAPRWPVSPRLRSPPPITKPTSILSLRKSDTDASAKTIPSSESSMLGSVPDLRSLDSETDDTASVPSGMRTPARGVSGASSTLETVQENSQPSTPALQLERALHLLDRKRDDASVAPKPLESKTSTVLESGNESGDKTETKKSTTMPPPSAGGRAPWPPKKALSLGGTISKGKPAAEGSTMTVETETVSSIPQIAVGGAVGPGNGGSLRAKPSTETIRPKKDKKKTARKPPSVTSGTASSKADIFEAKVASAVDEADSSDSEETFVYESNPPEIDRPRRYHSRTPSVTSMASQADLRNGVRSVMDGAHSIALKKSMKFANSYGTNGPDAATVDDDGKGTIRSGMGTGRGTGHHHHANRWGRNAGNGHASLFDNESPFQTATKSSKFSSRDPRQSSRPTSPRVANMKMSHGTSKKNSPISTGYEPDEGADDERTPLMGSARSIRSTRARRTGSSMRQLYQARRDQSLISRFGGCLVLMLMFVLVIAGGTVFLFSTSQPLTDVKILALKNILASEQDVIVDMKVSARNPNLVAVTVESMDMVAFAKSKYAGTDEEWWKGPPSDDFDGWIALGRTRSSRHSRRRTSTLSDPSLLYPAPHSDPDSTDPASPNLEIGHVYTFESPLIFEGSPFSTTHSLSLGELRIDKPGNATEPRGSERWGRVLQHEFELIIRGTLKYSLPLSQRIRSVSVEGRVTVQGNEAGHGPQDNGDGHGDELETNLHTRD